MSIPLAPSRSGLLPILLRGELQAQGDTVDLVKAYRISRAFGEALMARTVVVGRDCRNSSHALAEAVIEGLTASGSDVIDLGICGSEEMCFATMHHDACGGIELTDPDDTGAFNGMTMVRSLSSASHHERDLSMIRRLAKSGEFRSDRGEGRIVSATSSRDEYVRQILSFVDIRRLKPLRILVNAGKGAAGPAFDAIAEALSAQEAPLKFVRMYHAPDSSFPDNLRDPALHCNVEATSRAVVKADADFGVAWDSDFNRCLIFDHLGRCVPGHYLTGLLAQAIVLREPGAMVLVDPRAEWSGQALVARAGGRVQKSSSDLGDLKQALRRTRAAFGGDTAGHHCFRDFMSTESGMISFLLIAALLSRSHEPLSALVDDAWASVPSSGELRFPSTNPQAVMRRVEQALRAGVVSIERADGLTMTFRDWRLSLRAAKDSKALELNIEARESASLLVDRVTQVAAIIRAH
jgi:phosphomannomutase